MHATFVVVGSCELGRVCIHVLPSSHKTLTMHIRCIALSISVPGGLLGHVNRVEGNALQTAFVRKGKKLVTLFISKGSRVRLQNISCFPFASLAFRHILEIRLLKKPAAPTDLVRLRNL